MLIDFSHRVMNASNYFAYAVLCTCICFTSITGSAQSSNDQTIRDLRQKSNDAIKKHDTASLVLYWLNDVHVLTSRSTSIDGKQANQRAFQQEFQTKQDVVYVRTPATIEVFPNWNMAAEYGSWTGTWTSNGSAIRITGSYYAKWHKAGGSWKIKSEVYTPRACEGGDYCKTFNSQNGEVKK